MIFTECVYCNEPIIVSLDERYLDLLEDGRQLVSRHKCEKCGKYNYIEHRRIGGETFGEDDERVKKLKKYNPKNQATKKEMKSRKRGKDKMKQTKSEFGKGFIYNLILFAKHWWKFNNDLKVYRDMNQKYPEGFGDKLAIESWFNGAGDHFFEFEIPKQFKKKKVGKLAKELQERALSYRNNWRNEDLTVETFENFFKKLEELAMLIDKELGVKDVEASFK